MMAASLHSLTGSSGLDKATRPALQGLGSWGGWLGRAEPAGHARAGEGSQSQGLTTELGRHSSIIVCTPEMYIHNKCTAALLCTSAVYQ